MICRSWHEARLGFNETLLQWTARNSHMWMAYPQEVLGSFPEINTTRWSQGQRGLTKCYPLGDAPEPRGAQLLNGSRCLEVGSPLHRLKLKSSSLQSVRLSRPSNSNGDGKCEWKCNSSFLSFFRDPWLPAGVPSGALSGALFSSLFCGSTAIDQCLEWAASIGCEKWWPSQRSRQWPRWPNSACVKGPQSS